MTLEKAILVATKAHTGQTDKSGAPYIFHLLRVMMAVNSEARVIAVLHDVLEDTSVTIDYLVEQGLSGWEMEALCLLTKVKGTSYKEYLVRLNTNNLARGVKKADIMDNIDPVRLYRLDLDTVLRLTKKYSIALRFITGEIKEDEL